MKVVKKMEFKRKEDLGKFILNIPDQDYKTGYNPVKKVWWVRFLANG